MKTTLAPKLFRRPLVASVLAACLLRSVVPVQAAERWATLEAIHCVENPRNLARPGPCGELGAYQFRERTWRMHSKAPFVSALNRQASDAVAIEHYEFIKRELLRAGVPATPYRIALAWNGGVEAAVLGRAPAVARDYAERVTNLANSFDHGALASVR